MYEVGIWKAVKSLTAVVFKDEPKVKPDTEYEPFNFGLMKYKVPGKDLYGFIDSRGEIVIPTIYECSSAFFEGLALVQSNDKMGYINTKGEIVIPLIYAHASPFVNGTATVAIEDSVNGNIHKKYFVINKKGEKISEDFDYIGWRDNKSVMLMIAKRGQKYGFIDGFGKVKIPFIYDEYMSSRSEISSFADHVTSVLKDGKWGFIDTSYSEGKIIVQPQYKAVGTFRFGMAWVNDGTGISFIDKTGKIVCGKYVFCTSFNVGGLAMVKYKQGNEACLINKRGEIIYYVNDDGKGNLFNLRRRK